MCLNVDRSYSPKEAAAILGVTVHTIQVWDRAGKIKCLRLPSGRRRIPESEIRRMFNLQEERKEAIYARVSSHDQKEDLERQIKLLRERVSLDAIVFSDVMSGLNFRRKGFQSLLDAIVSKKVLKLYVTYEDRLARFGFDLIQWLCSKFGTEIVVVNGKEIFSPQEELVQDLIAIVTSFSAKLYGLRSHKTKKLLQTVKEVTVN
jgi:putative resolvase